MTALATATIYQRVKDILGFQPWAAVGTATSSTTTTVAVGDGTRWDEGAVLEFQADDDAVEPSGNDADEAGEQCWVQSVNSNNLTVIRGWNGTTPAAATAKTVYRDPTFTIKMIRDAVDLTLQSLWPYCWKMVNTTITPVSGKTWYDLGTGTAMGLIEVSQINATSPYNMYIYGAKGSNLPVNFAKNARDHSTTAIVATEGNTAIGFPNGFVFTTTDVQINYAAKLTATISGGSYSDLTDGVLAECVAYGAAAKLISFTENPRVTMEDISMGDSSVTPGARSGAGQRMYSLYMTYRDLYANECRRTIPIMPLGAGPKSSGNMVTGRYGTYGYTGI